MSRSFRHATPAVRVHYGPDSLEHLPAELDRLGCRRAVIVCGRSLARQGDALAAVGDALGGRLAGIFDGVQAHSPLPAVEAAAAALRRTGADAIVAVGGGSAVVTARAAGIMLAEERGIPELCTRFPPGRPPVSPKLLRPKLPQLVVPTTPTTAYAKAGTAVLDPEQRRRLTMFDPKTRAQALFIHPALGGTAPAGLVRGAALNAFVMAVQGLESAVREPLADALLLHAVRLLARDLRRIGTAEDGPDLRGELMLAALLCGQGTDYTTGGLASVIGHAVGARFDLDNGLVNAILLPHTLRFNAPATEGRLADVAALSGDRGSSVEAAAEAVETLFAELPVPRRLREVGVPEEALPELAAIAGADWFLHQNPRPVADAAELLPILRAAW